MFGIVNIINVMVGKVNIIVTNPIRRKGVIPMPSYGNIQGDVVFTVWGCRMVLLDHGNNIIVVLLGQCIRCKMNVILQN